MGTKGDGQEIITQAFYSSAAEPDGLNIDFGGDDKMMDLLDPDIPSSPFNAVCICREVTATMSYGTRLRM